MKCTHDHDEEPEICEGESLLLTATLVGCADGLARVHHHGKHVQVRPRVFDGLPVDQPNQNTSQDARLATVQLRCWSCDCFMYLNGTRTVSASVLLSVDSMTDTLLQHNVARSPSSVR